MAPRHGAGLGRPRTSRRSPVNHLGFPAMPIHVRANKGDYADACLLPGDPLRAKYIAETFMEDVVQRNSERGMLGYTGTFGGKPCRCSRPAWAARSPRS